MVSRDELLELLSVDFRRFLYDNLFSTENMSEAVTQTAAVTRKLNELTIETGIQQDSEARIYYDNAIFNPIYSKLFFKMQLSTMQNVFAFIGIKSSTGEPTSTMDESHAGFMIETVNNIPTLYATSGKIVNGNYMQQKIPILDWVPTNYLVYRIVKDKFAARPLPSVTPYFEGIEVVDTTRKWSKDIQTGDVTANNQDHYFVAYIRNTSGANKAMTINFILYGEEYAD